MKKTMLLICAATALGQQTNADVVINLVESGGNIVATMSGDIDLAATQGFVANSAGYDGYLDTLGAISITRQNTDYYGLDFSTWTPFGTGGIFENWDTSSGDAWAMFSNPVLGVPVGYTSGTALSSTATKFGRTFAGLGWTVGSHVSTFTNGNNSDTVTVNIGGYNLSVTGPCPGQLTVSWSGGSGQAQQGLVFGNSLGSTTIPNNNPCGGTVLGLTGNVHLVNPPGIFSNQGGSGSISGNAGSAACGHYLQLVEGGTCQVSNAAQIP